MSDIRIHECGDGGDLTITSGNDLQPEDTFFSVIYTSLFGGEAFYNIFEENNTDDVDFEESLRCEVSIANLNNIANIASHKLQWMIDVGICSNIDTSATAGEVTNSITVKIVIHKPDGDVSRYDLLWDRQMAELKYFKEIK